MVSLISEITDSKGRRSRRGWMFFDGECAFCMAFARRLQPTLEAHGFGVATLQDPRAQAQLDVPQSEVLVELRLLAGDGRQFGGADAIVFAARMVWWAWPLWLAAQIPGARPLLRAMYREVARRRNCSNATCDRHGPMHGQS
jgi:predicted DCC family thiol-disulfide oxidoreductase YuxK